MSRAHLRLPQRGTKIIFRARLALYQDTAVINLSARFDTGAVLFASAEEAPARLNSFDFKGWEWVCGLG